MQISVLVEPVAGNGYRARGAEPFGFSAEAATREEAIAKVQQLCQARLNGGAELVTVEVGPTPHPWRPFAGMFKDDPEFQEVQEIMAENRRKMDEESERAMSFFVLDTDILSLYQSGHPAVVQHVQAHPTDQLAVSVISVEEQLTGWYTKLRRAKKRDQLARAYQRLTNAVSFLSRVQLLPFPEAAIVRYENLRAAHRHSGKNDLRIAAIALEHGATLVTRNTKDFQQIPGLKIEDWSK